MERSTTQRGETPDTASKTHGDKREDCTAVVIILGTIGVLAVIAIAIILMLIALGIIAIGNMVVLGLLVLFVAIFLLGPRSFLSKKTCKEAGVQFGYRRH